MNKFKENVHKEKICYDIPIESITKDSVRYSK